MKPATQSEAKPATKPCPAKDERSVPHHACELPEGHAGSHEWTTPKTWPKGHAGKKVQF